MARTALSHARHATRDRLSERKPHLSERVELPRPEGLCATGAHKNLTFPVKKMKKREHLAVIRMLRG